MASKLSFLNSLRERKKPYNKDGNNEEELFIVKAAAWAWYQHNSCHEIKAMSEFDVTRTMIRRESGPSRYKLEAMEKEAKEGSNQIYNKESLLDAYEVQSISRHLNRILESNNNNDDKAASVHDDGKKTKKKKIRKGFFLRHGAICGREEDVIDPRTASRGHHNSRSAESAPSHN